MFIVSYSHGFGVDCWLADSKQAAQRSAVKVILTQIREEDLEVNLVFRDALADKDYLKVVQLWQEKTGETFGILFAGNVVKSDDYSDADLLLPEETE